jgi:hypothetical protein
MPEGHINSVTDLQEMECSDVFMGNQPRQVALKKLICPSGMMLLICHLAGWSGLLHTQL